MSGPVDQIRRRIDDLLFERPPTPARLTANLLVWGITCGLVAGLVAGRRPAVRVYRDRPEVDRHGRLLGGAHPAGSMGAVLGSVVAALVAAAALCSLMDRTTAGRGVLVALAVLLLAVAVRGPVGQPYASAEAGIWVLGDGEVVVVDRFDSTRLLLADLRRRGLDQPRLVVFRGPLPDGLADGLEQRLGPTSAGGHRHRWVPGPHPAEPGSGLGDPPGRCTWSGASCWSGGHRRPWCRVYRRSGDRRVGVRPPLRLHDPHTGHGDPKQDP